MRRLKDVQLVAVQGILLHLDLLLSGIFELVDFDGLWIFSLRFYYVQGVRGVDIFFLFDVFNHQLLGLRLLLEVGHRTRHGQGRLATKAEGL